MAKDIYIQMLNGDDTAVHGLSEWGIVANELPLKRFPEAKDLPTNDWHDEDGEEEYFPEKLVYKAYEVEAKLSIRSTSMEELSTNLRQFLEFVSKGYFSLYDPNRLLGRTNVRYLSYSDDAEYYNGYGDSGKQFLVQFTVKLKVNDPITNITLNV